MRQHLSRPCSIAVALVGAGVIAVTPVPAGPDAHTFDIRLSATDMILDLVRHGQSADNAAGLTGPLGTSAPGAPLTDTGEQQAVTVGNDIYTNDGSEIDGVYASDFLRTQQTAWPLMQLLAGNDPTAADIPGGPTPLDGGVDPDHILSGLAEINAGYFDGTPEYLGGIPYLVPILAWSLLGQWWVPMLGSANNPDGIAFEQRFSDAIDTIYNNGGATTDGDLHDVAFSHGAAMLAWTLMTVKNPDLSVILQDPVLPNTAQVVIDGNPTDGWTLVSWDGQDVPATPDLLTGLFVDWRDFITAPQVALYNIWEAVEGGDATDITAAVQTGLEQVAGALEQFPQAVIDTISGSLGDTTTDSLLAAV